MQVYFYNKTEKNKNSRTNFEYAKKFIRPVYFNPCTYNRPICNQFIYLLLLNRDIYIQTEQQNFETWNRHYCLRSKHQFVKGQTFYSPRSAVIEFHYVKLIVTTIRDHTILRTTHAVYGSPCRTATRFRIIVMEQHRLMRVFNQLETKSAAFVSHGKPVAIP